MNLLSWSISRVLSWTIIHLGDKLLCRSSNLPELWTGHPLSSYLVLLRVEFTLLHVVTNGTVCSYHTLSPLPFSRRSALCCTGRRLTPPGRYPALCPEKLGLSSPAVFRRLQPRLSDRLTFPIISHSFSNVNCFIIRH